MFDIDLVLKNGNKEMFVGIDKKEIEVVVEYFQGQGIPIKKEREDNPRYQNDYYQ